MLFMLEWLRAKKQVFVIGQQTEIQLQLKPQVFAEFRGQSLAQVVFPAAKVHALVNQCL